MIRLLQPGALTKGWIAPVVHLILAVAAKEEKGVSRRAEVV